MANAKDKQATPPVKANHEADLPDGWVFTIFGDKDGILEAKSNGNVKMRLKNVILPLPYTPAAIEAACDGVEFVVVETDGTEHKVTGVHAAGMRGVMLAVEVFRGMARSGKYTELEIREACLAFRKIAGRSRQGVKRATTEAEVEAKVAILKRSGQYDGWSDLRLWKEASRMLGILK